MSKKIKTISVVCAAAALSCGLMSFTDNTPASSLPVPKALEEEAVNIAVSNGLLSTSEAQLIVNNHVIQQCVDTFVCSGYKPSAAVDKIAEFGVASGKFQTKAQVKQTIKKTVEKARKEEANWKKLYSILGL